MKTLGAIALLTVFVLPALAAGNLDGTYTGPQKRTCDTGDEPDRTITLEIKDNAVSYTSHYGDATSTATTAIASDGTFHISVRTQSGKRASASQSTIEGKVDNNETITGSLTVFSSLGNCEGTFTATRQPT